MLHNSPGVTFCASTVFRPQLRINRLTSRGAAAKLGDSVMVAGTWLLVDRCQLVTRSATYETLLPLAGNVHTEWVSAGVAFICALVERLRNTVER